MKKFTNKIVSFTLIFMTIVGGLTISKTSIHGATGGVGYTIEETFPDQNLAQAVANEISGGNISEILTQAMVDNLLDLQAPSENISDLTGIEVLVNLQNLNLSDNQVTSIPEEIFDLSALTYLNLHNNQVTNISENIGNLSNLQWLDVSNNQLINLPEKITDLLNLKILNLSDNQLASIPESIGNLSDLQILNLTSNKLTHLPESLGDLSELLYLDLGDNQITSIPNSIDGLSNLQRLNLNTNQLTSLPDSILEVPILQWLDLSNNRLTNIPEALYTIAIPSFYIASQTFEEDIANGYRNQDYTVEALPIFEQVLTFGDGSALTYTLSKPDGSSESLTPTIVNGKFMIEGSKLGDVGNYQLVASINGGKLYPATYTLNFEVTALPKVVFDYNDGTGTTTFLEVAEGAFIPKPTDIVREGYTFIGWAKAFHSDGTPILWNFETDRMPANNITLWATYEKIEPTDPANPSGTVVKTGDSNNPLHLLMLLTGMLISGSYLATRIKKQK